jgi:spore coat polysaccharide biosynthesis protein SpsF
MASTRLPGKALAPLAGRSLVGWCLDRLRLTVPGVVLLATTWKPEDDVLEREASARNIRTFRGPAEDVLRRFRLAATSVGARYLVRATADNPAVDIDAPVRLLRLIAATGADYVVECGLPYGAGVEVMSMSALQRADARVTDPQDREHVTLAMRRDQRWFNALEVSAPVRLRRSDLRLTVDTDEDLRFMREVLSCARGVSDEPSLSAIIAAADEVLAGEAVR